MISCSTKSNPTTTTPITTDTSTTLTVLALPNGTAAPDYNSSTIEPIWSTAAPLAVTADAIGDNFTGSSFPVSIKSVVSAQNIYFLVQYNDPSPNYYGQPLHFHGGNPQTASNWTRDATYEDGVSLIFEDPANQGKSGTKTFTSDGCTMLCHTTTTAQWDKGMFSESNGGRYDLWYWHAGKGNGSGYADDKISIGVPSYGIIKDDDNAEIYHNNVDNSPGYLPFYVAGKNSNRNLDPLYFIAEESEQTFVNGVAINPATNSAWKADDIVPASTIALPQDASNDYFDVHAKGYYSNGSWTVKFQRKLNTGIYNLDTQFASGNEYLFSFAVHNNNAPGNHYGAANKSFKLKIP